MSPPVRPPLDLRVPCDGWAVHVVAEALGSDEAGAENLLAFGGVYVNKKRLDGDVALRAGDYIRIHLRPRRFPAGDVRWKDRIVHETADFVVVDKPAGVPVHATCDNAVENVVYQVSRALGNRLFVVHRLDLTTHGLLVLARSDTFRAYFNRLIAERGVTKRYRALVPRALAPGEIVHYMRPDRNAPRVVSREPNEGWKRCALRIESCRETAGVFELEMTLLTGRNHQIRAQLAALGAPILGDALYGSDLPPPCGLGPGEAIALQACELAFAGERFGLSAAWSVC